jgi:hypothetical protein
MTCYTIGLDAEDSLDGTLYTSLEEAKKTLKELEDGDYKVYKITVEECPN